MSGSWQVALHNARMDPSIHTHNALNDTFYALSQKSSSGPLVSILSRSFRSTTPVHRLSRSARYARTSACASLTFSRTRCASFVTSLSIFSNKSSSEMICRGGIGVSGSGLSFCFVVDFNALMRGEGVGAGENESVGRGLQMPWAMSVAVKSSASEPESRGEREMCRGRSGSGDVAEAIASA